MKNRVYLILFFSINAIIFGAIGFFIFTNYGGNNCDSPAIGCDCFCCHMFDLRGYEACGVFGLLFGMILGIFISLAIYAKYYNKRNKC